MCVCACVQALLCSFLIFVLPNENLGCKDLSKRWASANACLLLSHSLFLSLSLSKAAGGGAGGGCGAAASAGGVAQAAAGEREAMQQ